jgi:two-component system sensor histidine kinase UhpB
LIIREPWHSLTDPLIRFEQVTPFILLIATVISFLTLIFGLRSVVQPLRELRLRANQIGQGNFHAAMQPVGGVKEIEDLRVTLHEMAVRIQSYQTALQDYARAVTQALEEERARLARELHDETIQTLIALGHKSQMAQRALTRDPEQAGIRLGEVRQMLQQAIEEVRRFSRALHPHYLEELGLVTALETLAHEAGADFQVQGSAQRIIPEQELTFYRIAQEALNNALRHAGASKIPVEFLFETLKITLRVCDNGSGFELPSYFNDLTRTGHFGLIGMRERAQLAGGKLDIRSSLAQGTTVTFTLVV